LFSYWKLRCNLDKIFALVEDIAIFLSVAMGRPAAADRNGEDCDMEDQSAVPGLDLVIQREEKG
jgi:hypothetical protein